jgi:hypothetical protein
MKKKKKKRRRRRRKKGSSQVRRAGTRSRRGHTTGGWEISSTRVRMTRPSLRASPERPCMTTTFAKRE